MNELIDFERIGNIAHIALNRPETFNAFNLDMVKSLATHLTGLATDKSVDGIVITGKGKAFCAGGDLKWAVEFSDSLGSSFHTLASQFHLAIVEIRRMRKPVVAAINGIAAGGGFSLALACDFRVMETSAILRQAYTSNGLSIDGGGTFILPRIVGFSRALEIAAFDNPISSKEALELGLVTKVVEDGRSKEEALDMLNRLTKRSIHSYGWSKKLLFESYKNAFESQLESEREGLAECANHPDGAEGLQAFIEKRKPSFTT
jgi:2-(1,2-epoxy-1,2-dihydrophenyl)acetyl-CoA isomerase